MTRDEYQRYTMGICRRPGCGQSRLSTHELCACCADDEQRAVERVRRAVAVRA